MAFSVRIDLDDGTSDVKTFAVRPRAEERFYGAVKYIVNGRTVRCRDGRSATAEAVALYRTSTDSPSDSKIEVLHGSAELVERYDDRPGWGLGLVVELDDDLQLIVNGVRLNP